MCRFLYIDRCWKSDQERMGQMLEHLAKVSKVKFDVGLNSFHKSPKTVLTIFRLTCNQEFHLPCSKRMGRHLSVVITSFYFSLRAPISPRKQERSLMSLQPKLTRSPSNIYCTQGQLDSATWLERWEKVSVISSRLLRAKTIKMFSNFRWQPRCHLRCDHCLSRQSSWNWSRSCQWKHPLRNTLPHQKVLRTLHCQHPCAIYLKLWTLENLKILYCQT